VIRKNFFNLALLTIQDSCTDSNCCAIAAQSACSLLACVLELEDIDTFHAQPANTGT